MLHVLTTGAYYPPVVTTWKILTTGASYLTAGTLIGIGPLFKIPFSQKYFSLVYQLITSTIWRIFFSVRGVPLPPPDLKLFLFESQMRMIFTNSGSDYDRSTRRLRISTFRFPLHFLAVSK